MKLKMLDLSSNLLFSLKQVDRINLIDLAVLNLDKNIRVSNIKQYCKCSCKAPTLISTNSNSFRPLYNSMQYLQEKVYNKKTIYMH